MSTVVDLYIGGTCSDGEPGGQVYTADLILQSPYTEPSPYLLVLRSSPDVAAITGTMEVTELADNADLDGEYRSGRDPVLGTLDSIERRDVADLIAESDLYDVSGDMEVLEDSGSVAIEASFDGIAIRRADIAVTEAKDVVEVESEYDPRWVAIAEVTEAADQSDLVFGFLPYVGPGFLNTTERRDTATEWDGLNIYDVAGTMDSATESADLAEIEARTGAAFEESTEDAVLVTELLVGEANIVSLVDRVVVQESLDYSRDISQVDTLLFDETLSSITAIVSVITDSVITEDELGALSFGATVDVVQVTDTLLGQDEPGFITDRLNLSDSLTSIATLSGAFLETALVTDQLAYGFIGSSADTINVTDALLSSLDFAAAITDTVTVSEQLSGTISVYAELTDGVLFGDSITGTLALVGVLSDTVLAGDALATEAQTIVVVNAETGAVSTYTLTPLIRGLMDFQGVLYLAGPEGLYALDATQDDSGSVVWTLRTGFSNLGTDKLKRVRDCNFQARTEGDTTFQVVSDRYGQKQEWNYRLPPLTRESYRDGVVKVGQGIQSVYWQFAAEGVGPAEIDQLRLVVEPLSRRR